MSNPLLQRLLDPNRVTVFDGAMGTMLYSKGVYINQCYDELNVRAPDSVSRCPISRTPLAVSVFQRKCTYKMLRPGAQSNAARLFESLDVVLAGPADEGIGAPNRQLVDAPLRGQAQLCP